MSSFFYLVSFDDRLNLRAKVAVIGNPIYLEFMELSVNKHYEIEVLSSFLSSEEFEALNPIVKSETLIVRN